MLLHPPSLNPPHLRPSLLNTQADCEVREYRDKIRERRQQQQQRRQQQQHQAKSSVAESPVDSDQELETNFTGLRTGISSRGGGSEVEMGNPEITSDSGAASSAGGVGGGSEARDGGRSLDGSVRSVSGGSDSDWF